MRWVNPLFFQIMEGISLSQLLCGDIRADRHLLKPKARRPWWVTIQLLRKLPMTASNAAGIPMTSAKLALELILCGSSKVNSRPKHRKA